MIKTDFSSLKSSFVQGAVFVALIAGYFLVPVTNAAIDDAMPATIPAEIVADWKAQGGTAEEIKASLPAEYQAKCDGTFNSACHWRRVYRMSRYPYLDKILFTRHHNVGNIAIGFWVNVGPSDVTDTDFQPKGALCLLKFDNYYSQYKEILTKNDACVKDPCISFDGKKVLFAMSGNSKGTGYRIFEMEIDNPGSIKQLTENPAGLTVADFEPCYLPNGEIMFASTRCFGVIDCGWQPTSNMFIMNGEGKYMRRVGFDQVHTFFPVLRPDGTVMYSRWEYNDRDIANIAGLFWMYPDGCHQTELYGNQTTWPMCLQHGRPVPGNPSKYFAIVSAHHGDYSGEVCVIDVTKTTNGPEIVKMISPPRETKTRDNNDTFAFGGVYRNSEYPYPLDEEWYLVSYHDENKYNSMSYMHNTGKFRIYLKNVDGTSRELLAWGDQSLHHPMVVAPWTDIWGEDPFPIAGQANFKDSMGTYIMQDVYEGAGMEGVDKASGVAKKLRVIEIKYRVSGACDNGWAGMVSGAKPSNVIFSAPDICPVALWGGSWDVKNVLGEATIKADGSASFKVPARTPVYFQVLDANGCSIADMRSWSTLMPGETFACLGCHESKNEAPPVGSLQATSAQKLETPLGIENQGFDFPKMVQPILDKYCVSCHKAGHASGFDLTGNLVMNNAAKKSYATSYTSLFKGIGASKSNKAINIASIFSQAEQMPPYSYGAVKSGLIKAINGGVSAMNNINLPDKEKRILACWIDLEAPHSGSYDSYMSSSDAQRYKQLEATAQKWYDIEAQNVKAWAAVQPTGIKPEDHGRVKTIAVADNGLRIEYLPVQRALVLKNFYRGNLTLVDLRGKVISRMDLSDLQTDNVTVSLPVSLSTGCYVARFKGVNGIQQAKISITQ
ncbi:MAG: hypothetical protein JW863_16965 [Chitinispirillaceae bacterium]|nr:hypothetical protein [Chitinispirillaceae bacterium]